MELKEHIRELSAFGFARPPASEAEEAAGSYLEENFINYGLETGRIVYPVLKNYSWFNVLTYFLYILAIMVFPSAPLIAVLITAMASFLMRLDLYLWPAISRFFAWKNRSFSIVGRKKASEESRHTILITASMDSRKGYYLSAGLRSWITKLEYISGLSRTLQLLALTAGAVLSQFSITFWVRISWMVTWPGSILLWLLFYLELRRWFNGSWHSTVNDNDSSLAVLLGLADRLREVEFQHCDVVLAALGGDRDAGVGMHNLLSSLPSVWQKNTDIINLEAVGGGKLRWLGREGLSRPIPASEELLDLGELIARGLETELLVSERLTRRTSGAVARSRGYAAITLMGMDKDGLACNFTQTVNRVEKFALVSEEQMVAVREAILSMIALTDHQL